MIVNVDYQVVVDCIATLLVISFPIYLVFEIANRLMNLMLDFIGGSKTKVL